MQGIAGKASAGLVAVSGYLILVAAAFGQSSSVEGYGGGGGAVSAGVGSGGAGGTAAGALPFTGLDLIFVAIAGAVALFLGLVLRRSGRAQA